MMMQHLQLPRRIASNELQPICIQLAPYTDDSMTRQHVKLSHNICCAIKTHIHKHTNIQFE